MFWVRPSENAFQMCSLLVHRSHFRLVTDLYFEGWSLTSLREERILMDSRRCEGQRWEAAIEMKACPSWPDSAGVHLHGVIVYWGHISLLTSKIPPAPWRGDTRKDPLRKQPIRWVRVKITHKWQCRSVCVCVLMGLYYLKNIFNVFR